LVLGEGLKSVSEIKTEIELNSLMNLLCDLIQKRIQGFHTTIVIIFALMFIFAISGTFADVSYYDILGKSLLVEERPSFFVWHQILSGAG
jgi:hypothetical protein